MNKTTLAVSPEVGSAKEGYGRDGDGLVLILFRQVVSAEQDDAGLVEVVFPEARYPEAKPELMVVEVHHNRTGCTSAPVCRLTDRSPYSPVRNPSSQSCLESKG